MKTLAEYFATYKDKRILDFLQEKNVLEKQCEWYEADSYSTWYVKTLMYNAKQYAKNIVVPKLKPKLKNRKGYILVKSEEGYNWCAACRSQKSCNNRVSKCNTLLEIVSDTLFEYSAYTHQPFEKLSIDIIQLDELKKDEEFGKFFINNENTSAVNVKSAFWPQPEI